MWRIRNLSSELQAELDILKQTGADYSLVWDFEPKLFISDVNKSVALLEQLQTKVQQALEISEHLLTTETESLDKDLKEFIPRLFNLGLIKQKPDLPALLTDQTGLTKERLSKIFQVKTSQQKLLGELKTEAGSKLPELEQAKKPINPLWLKTLSEQKSLIASLAAAEKAGQLLMWSISGTELAGNEANRSSSLGLGGVILMGANISSSGQLLQLTNAIQQTNKLIPLLIATDQEGGLVRRVKWDNTAGEKAWEGMSDKGICDLATSRSQTLKTGGINLNLAPVVDITYPGSGFINNRTISANVQTVINRSRQFVDCSQAAGIAVTLKHFPGHGATEDDSHLTIPVIKKTKAEWLQSDALPFKEIMSAKLIMAGHLQFSAIDSKPATLSPILLSDILRKELGYQGVVISDDMNQLQQATHIDWKSAVKESLAAGVDILLYVGFPATKEDIHKEVTRLITSGEISGELVNAKLERILLLKSSL